MCKECFFTALEEEVHKTITDANLFTSGDNVAIGASGGKGKSHLIKLINMRMIDK